MDRRRDIGPHQDVGRGLGPAGAQDNAPHRKHLLGHLQQDVQPRFLQDAGAVPDEAEEGEVRLQAVLPEQVGVQAGLQMAGTRRSLSGLLLHTSSSCCLPLRSLRGEEQVYCKFYNELGRVLVNEFQPVLHLDEAAGGAEERDFNSSSQRDTGG